jgi:4-hydroxy-3-methylbut-2-enyl diphosphate reductase IspH
VDHPVYGDEAAVQLVVGSKSHYEVLAVIQFTPEDAHVLSEELRRAAEAANIEAEKSAQTTLEEN